MTEETYRYQGHELPYFPADFGFKWPNRDESLAGDIPTLADVDRHVLPHLDKDHRRVVVQAGGAVGVWPKRFAQLFDAVYSFEPFPESFHCLCVNCPELNVFKFNAALGEIPGWCRMGFPEHLERSEEGKENIGGFRVLGVGDVPVVTLDSFKWRVVDLLYLDLEGYELFALRGGLAMIRRCKPVIVLEDKAGCCKQFGYEVGDVEELLAGHGYYTIERFHGGRDVILAPRE